MEKALILVDGRFSTTDGKTAHGLVRYSERYKIVGLIDSTLAGEDAGRILDGKPDGIKIYSSVNEGLAETGANTLIIGVATDGGYLPKGYRAMVKEAIENKLNVVSGLHEFLSDDLELSCLAKEHNVSILDVRKLYRNRKDFFTGNIEKVNSIKIAVLGTDAAIGKRTTAILLTEAFKELGLRAAFIGTGQTSWMQGAKYCVVIDAMVNDFVAGGIESEIWRAFQEERPDVIIIAGQGSIVHPAYPGGFEIIAAGRPDAILLQHAPKRPHLDGFPEYQMPDLDRVIRIIELLSQKQVVAITINHENMARDEVEECVREYEARYGVVACDPLIHGMDRVARGMVEKFAGLGRKHGH